MPIRLHWRALLIGIGIALAVFLGVRALVRSAVPAMPELVGPLTPDSPVARALEAGREARTGNRAQDAVAIYSDYLAHHPRPLIYASMVLSERAGAYEKLNRLDRAEADLNAALKLVPYATHLYEERGAFYARHMRYDEALADFRAGTKKAPQDGRYDFAAAKMYESRGDYQFAIQRLDEAIRREPDKSKYYFERGGAHNFTAMYRAAVTDFTRALAVPDPRASKREAVRPHFGRGYALMELGEYRRAIADLDRVLAVVPKASNALAYRGAAYQGLGDTATAVADYKTALAIDPNQALAKRRLQALQGVR